MALTTQDFTTLVRNQVTAIQGAASTLVDLTIGSVLRAVVEANAAIVLWLQGLILQLLATTRAASSSSADLDSWMADYGVSRLQGVAASGVVTFSRFTATQQAVVPIGALVQSADGQQQFAVTLDSGDDNYDAGLGGYVLGVSIASIPVPVQAIAAGTAGNVLAGQINTIIQAMPGIDTVSNSASFVTGVDTESDTALRARFVVYIASLSKATKVAVSYAIEALQQGVSFSIVENEEYNGTARNGYFYVVVDDGTGNPSDEFLATVANAIDIVRPLTVTFGVFAPDVVTANVSLTIAVSADYDHDAVAGDVQTAIEAYIATLTVGQTLFYSRLVQVAYDASEGITNVTAVLLNTGTADLVATNKQVIQAGTVTVS